MKRNALAEDGVPVFQDFPGRRLVTAANLEGRYVGAAAKIADCASSDDDQRKRHVEDEDRYERGGCDRNHYPVLEGPASNPKHSLDDNREHCALQPKEHTLDCGHVTEQNVDVAQPQDRDKAGQDEEQARDHSAFGLVEQPADVDGQLVGLWTRQEHAVVQGVQETMFSHPTLLIDNDAVHKGDLTCGTTEAKRRDTRPDFYSFGERDDITV